MAGTRIAVTGLGALSALGLTVEENWIAARDGRGGIKPMELGSGEYGPPAFTVPLARVPDTFAAAYAERTAALKPGALDPFSQFALAATAEALTQAGLSGAGELLTNAAIVFGHGFNGLETIEAAYQRYFGMKSPRLHPQTVPKMMMSAPVSAIAMAFGVHGPCFSVSSACASSAHAIVQGAALIAMGEAEIAIVGGSEASTSPGALRCWEAIGAVSKTMCRPFSQGRDGMVIGEGAAAMVLERYEHAVARGAPILAELIGTGMTSDAFHITQPSSDGQAATMRAAARKAKLEDRDDILISAHGTGTPLNDQAESRAIIDVFKAGDRLPVIATKSAHGHLLGGSAALQAIIGLKALAAGLAPPVLNYLGPDPNCAVNVITGAAQPIAARVLVQNAFAFGGLNVSLAFALP